MVTDIFTYSTLKFLSQKQQGLKRSHENVKIKADLSEKGRHKQRIERRQMKKMAAERKKCEMQRKDY
jgi:hypothetical protein